VTYNHDIFSTQFPLTTFELSQMHVQRQIKTIPHNLCLRLGLVGHRKRAISAVSTRLAAMHPIAPREAVFAAKRYRSLVL
jgi:hypothetical protein